MARLVIHDTAGHPFQVELSRELARRGHEVLHLYSSGLQTPRGALVLRDDDPDGLQIEGIGTRRPIQKYNYARRYFQEKEYARSVTRRIQEFHPDSVLSGNAQLDVQRAIQKMCRRSGIRFHFWVQDLLGAASTRILGDKLGPAGRMIGRRYERMEHALARASDGVVAITPDFRPLMESWGVGTDKIQVIPNWAPLDEIRPMKKKNPWSEAHGFADGFNFVYTGTLGLKHNPQLLWDLAVAMDGQADVIVTSEGLGADFLRQKHGEEPRPNLHVLGFQPFEVYSDVLGAADALVAILEPEAGVMSVPSKVLSYHCAGKPILLSAPSENLASRIVEAAGSGKAVPAEDTDAFLTEASSLLQDASLRKTLAKAARAYAESTFEIEAIATRFEDVLVPTDD